MGVNSDLELLPPHSLEAEQAVLGAMLADQRSIPRVLGMLEAEHFYHYGHRLLYAAILELWRYEGEVDVVTVGSWLKDLGQLDEVGGIVLLHTLAAGVATAANIQHHARLVRTKADSRALMEMGAEVTQRSGAGEPPGETAQWLLAALLGRLHDDQRRRFWGMPEIGVEARKVLAKALANPRRWAGLDSGFVPLNDRLNGLCPQEFTVLGGRPGMGKTRLVLQIVRHVVRTGQGSALMFSLEMGRVQLQQVWASSEAAIPLRDLRRGQLSEAQQQRLAVCQDEIERWSVQVDDGSPLTVAEMFSSTERALAHDPNIKLVVVDYLQLMRGPGESRQAMYDDITQGLKDYKKRYGVHLLVLSQLSRAVELRDNRRPQTSDLRDTGGIEQNADNLILMYRPGAYDHIVEQARKEDAKQHTQLTADVLSRVELLLPKVRFDEPGIVRLRWTPPAPFTCAAPAAPYAGWGAPNGNETLDLVTI